MTPALSVISFWLSLIFPTAAEKFFFHYSHAIMTHDDDDDDEEMTITQKIIKTR